MPETDRAAFGSLLDENPAAAPGGRPGLAQTLRAWRSSAAQHAQALWSRPLTRRLTMGVASVAAVGLGLMIYLAIRPVPKPDYAKAEIPRLFDYTLLTDEFNRLPVEERIELVGQLYERVRSMDAAESAMMAAFFAGVAGEARQQIERNAGKLLIDATDLVARDYAAVPPEQRGEYLDDAYVRLVRLTAPFDGSIEERTDEELIERGRRDASRNQEVMESGEVSAGQASRMLVFMDKQIQNSASTSQQQRLTLFMRDLSRHLRGERVGG